MGEGRWTDSWPPTSWQRRWMPSLFEIFLFFPSRHFLNKISVDFFFFGGGGREMVHLRQTTSTDCLLWVRQNFNCPKPFLSTKCKLCIVSSYNYNIWPTQNEKKKKTSTNSRAHDLYLNDCLFTMHLSICSKDVNGAKTSNDKSYLTKKKKTTTKDTLSRCHWMCFMSNKRDPLSELLVPLALCFYSDELLRREEAF